MNRIQHAVSVPPARAGMAQTVLQRVKRGEPFPPHARGWTGVSLIVTGSVAVPPARAGMDPSQAP